MGFPSSAHFIYIPLVLILGVVLGFVWGSRATREAYTLEQRRVDERASRKALRKAQAEIQAETEAAQNATPGGPPPSNRS